MRSLYFLLLLLPVTLLAQTTPSAQQTHRLAQAGRLWGQIKYFHPWLPCKAINWDSAFVAAVPGILAANTDDEYAAVLQRMLAVLGDKATTVSAKKPAPSVAFTNTERGRAYFLDDSVLVVRLNSKAIADDWNETERVMQSATSQLPKARAVVFDLRLTEPGSRLAQAGEVNYEFTKAYLNNALCPPNLALPGERWLMHEGFRSEAQENDMYQSFFKISHAPFVRSFGQKPKPVVFLLNEHVAVPKVAALLQKQGLARILSEQADEDPAALESRAISTLDYPLDSLLVRIRKTDLVDEAGVMALRADSVLTPQTDNALNLQKAIDLARKPWQKFPRPSDPPGRYTGLWKADRYPRAPLPDLGHRVLAAAKIHAVIQYFFPNKDLMDANWDSVYVQHLPAFVAASDPVAYAQAVTRFYAHIQDSHGFTGTFLQTAFQPFFKAQVPASVLLSNVQNQLVVSRILSDSAARREGLQVGDVVLRIDGKDALGTLASVRPYFPASNREAQDRELSKLLLTGDDGTIARLTVQKANGMQKEITLTRRKAYQRAFQELTTRSPFARPMRVCTTLATNVGYVDLLQLTVDNLDSVMNALRRTKAIIFDDRSYPSSAAQQVFNYLPDMQREKVGLRQPVVDADVIQYGDGAMRKTAAATFTDVPKPLVRQWVYGGKTVVLFNEFTQSYAEGLAGRFRAVGAVGIGSHTAGANGDITSFVIPGGFLFFSGLKAAMQRTGVLPDIPVLPTLQGIRAGRDEVLERAVRYVTTGK
jgi:C-terminal processing protease CtpA/Prc